MCDKCKTSEEYIDNHGFGVSDRLLYTNEPIIIKSQKSWKSQVALVKMLGLNYDDFKWYEKLELRFYFFIKQFKNKLKKR